jgi:hypothetical protein
MQLEARVESRIRQGIDIEREVEREYLSGLFKEGFATVSDFASTIDQKIGELFDELRIVRDARRAVDRDARVLDLPPLPRASKVVN